MVLADIETGVEISNGESIPLAQIVVGPRRSQVEFEEPSEVRSVGAILRGENAPPAQSPMSSGYKAGRVKGWGPLNRDDYVAYQTVFDGPEAKELSVGRVLCNHREEQAVTLHAYRGCWSGTKVVFVPQYQSREGYTDEATSELAMERVLYSSLVLQVELLQDGGLTTLFIAYSF